MSERSTVAIDAKAVEAARDTLRLSEAKPFDDTSKDRVVSFAEGYRAALEDLGLVTPKETVAK